MKIINCGSRELPDGRYHFYVEIGDAEGEEGMSPLLVDGKHIDWDVFTSSYFSAVTILRRSGRIPDQYMIFDCEEEVYVNLTEFFGV